jgi:hypothetical protein
MSNGVLGSVRWLWPVLSATKTSIALKIPASPQMARPRRGVAIHGQGPLSLFLAVRRTPVFDFRESVFPNPRDGIRRKGGMKLNHPQGLPERTILFRGTGDEVEQDLRDRVVWSGWQTKPLI